MFFKKRRENKRKELRKDKYLELNKRLRKKHGIICRWYINAYKGNHNKREEFINSRLYPFFGNGGCVNGRYGELPKSFNLWSGINTAFLEDFDYYPIEKLQTLYDEIEIEFPEAFLDVKRLDKLNQLGI